MVEFSIVGAASISDAAIADFTAEIFVVDAVFVLVLVTVAESVDFPVSSIVVATVALSAASTSDTLLVSSLWGGGGRI